MHALDVIRSGIYLLAGLWFVPTHSLGSESFSTPAPGWNDAPSDAVVVFNELMYHPYPDVPSLEWVELHNQMAVDMDLSGWHLTGGIQFQFPAGTTLSRGGYLLVAAAPSALGTLTQSTQVFGPWTGRLNNSGDVITLRNHNGRLMDEIHYLDVPPWPTAGDGSGASLSKIRRSTASGPAANWRASTRAGGTPGDTNFPDVEKDEPRSRSLVTGLSPAFWSNPIDPSQDGSWTGAENPASLAGWSPGFASLGFESGVAADFSLRAPDRYWPLDGSFLETGGSNSDGASELVGFVEQAPPISGRRSSADFSGANAYVQIPDALDPTAYTLSAWIRVDTIRASSLIVRTSASGPSASWSHQLRLASGGRLEHYLYDGNAKLVRGTNVIQKGRWYHVAGTARNNGVMRLFVNGIQDGPDRPVASMWPDGDQWRLGSNSGDDRNFLDGQMSDVALWHQEWSPAQIAQLAALPSPSLASGLHGWFETDTGRLTNPVVRVRIPFVLSDPSGLDRMALSMNYADGFVAWLNGQELARENFVGGAGWNSRAATSRLDLEAVQTVTWDVTSALSSLKSGTNWFAVQVMNHSASESNLLANARLSVREKVPVSDPIQVAFSEVGNGGVGSVWVEIHNLGEVGVELGGLEVSSAQTPRIALGQGVLAPGAYHAFDVTTLGLTANIGDKLFLTAASGSLVLDGVRVTGFLQGRKADQLHGEWFRPERPTWGDANTFRWEEDIVINEIMYHHPPRYPKAEVPAESTNTVIMPFDQVWKYNATSILTGQPWMDPLYDDSSWNSGAGVLGLASGTMPVPLKTTITGNGRTTFYFRTPFVSPKLLENEQLIMTGLLDDGAIVYLNGREVFRHNLPAGEISHTNRALTNIVLNALLPPWPLPSEHLLVGTNQLAVELHQNVTNLTADFLLGLRSHVAHWTKPAIEGESFSEDPEEWIELHNRGGEKRNLAGWRLDDAVTCTLPPGTWIEPGGYLVLASDSVRFGARHPGVAVAAEFQGTLSDRGERIVLRDAWGNPADEVRYWTERPWPESADGNGSSLELRDPRADNSVPESWEASDESMASGWRRYTIRGIARTPLYAPAQSGFHELRLSLLDAGEVLLDRISVVEDPGFSPRELIPDGDFIVGNAKWRMTGNHIQSGIQLDPQRSGERVLRLRSSGPGSYLNNLVETSLKVGNALVPVVNGREYSISFDARWLSGSPMVRAELYYNKLAGTVRVDQPGQHGTPGQRNSRWIPNLGPTMSGMFHEPAAPAPGEAVRVRVKITDPDGIQSAILRYSLNGGKTWEETAMAPQATPWFVGELPTQTNAAMFQFYVAARDQQLGESFYPAGGTNSRAMIRVQPRLSPQPKLPVMRIWMDSREALGFMPLTNLVSDQSMPCTVVLNDREIYYEAGVRLHGSMHSRQSQESTGFNLRFPGDRPYRGVRTSFILRRRDHQEILCRHMLVNGSEIPANYDDFLYLVSPLPGNLGVARVILGNDDASFLRSTFVRGDEAQVFKMEGIREFQTTDTGSAEGYKVAHPIGWIQTFDITNQGDDQEQYRWSTLISNRRDRDDYSGYIRMAKTFALTGNALREAVEPVMDVDQWSRLFSLQSLCGVGDVYTVDNPHNLGYVVRPSDGRVLALQNDWSFPFYQGTSTPLIGIQNLSKIFNLPSYKRLFWGNVKEWTESTFNPTYMQKWAAHYEEVTGEGMRAGLDYIHSRRNYARSQFPKVVPFEITTFGGLNFATNASVITLQGRGWIDVSRLTLNGESQGLEVEWLDGERWETLVALNQGTNVIHLRALDRHGNMVGDDSITVDANITDHPQRDFLRIVEVMYQPAAPTAEERLAGILDGDQFEFIEIQNLAAVPVSLQGVRFTAGIQFNFGSGADGQLGPGQRGLIVRDAVAFRFRYPDAGPILGQYQGALNNGGETIRWEDRAGLVIQEFRYREGGDWPEAGGETGKSLVLVDFDANPGHGSSWMASWVAGGTPGQTEPVLLALEPVMVSDGMLRLRMILPAGGPVILQARSSLSASGWEEIESFAAQTAASVRSIDVPLNRGFSARFYRLWRP